MSNGWIGVDFDGTLAHYDGWKGEDVFGEPIPAMVDRVKCWIADGERVKIFTARLSGLEDRPEALKQVINGIQAWCLKNIGKVLKVTNVKDLHMRELWDDRAVQVEMNTGRRIGGEPAFQQEEFEAWFEDFSSRYGIDGIPRYFYGKKAWEAAKAGK